MEATHAGLDQAGTPQEGEQPWDGGGSGRHRVDPAVLGYLMAPAGLPVIVVLEQVGVVAWHGLWFWLGLFLLSTVANLSANRACEHMWSPARSQVRMAVQAGTITAVIYATGWGPVLIPAYSVGALQTFSQEGSRVWRWSLIWGVVGAAVGQIFLASGLAPSFLSLRNAQAVAVMSTFILCFIVRIAAVIVERREFAERSLRESEERFRSLVQHSTDTTLVVAANSRITYASPAARDLLEMSPEEIVGQDVMGFVHPDDAERVATQLAGDLEMSDVSRQVEVKLIGGKGRVRNVEAVVTDLLEEPAVSGWVVNMRDISDRKTAEALLVHQAEHDGLTGLPNRNAVLDRADVMLARCHASRRRLAVFFLDVDNFKDINDTLGHEAGDEVLEAIATRLAAQLRGGEVIGRMGGDEFVVLIESEVSDDSIAAVAKRLRAAAARPVRVFGEEGPLVHLTISIGVTHGLPDNANELFREADMALYQAKLAGRDAWVSFAPEMRSSALQRLQLQAELATAQSEGQFTLLFQPIYEIHRGQLAGVEALLRWEHPVQGTLTPDHFIGVLEQSGRIIEVGRWVLDEACRSAARWWSAGHEIGITVNASAQQLEDPTFVDDVSDAMARHGVPRSALVIEITESGLIQATETANRSLAVLKERGVRVAIDDFGTGYSSLAYLLQFDVDVLKIDRSFVAAMATSNHATAVVRAVLQLSKTLDLQVVAEGIEESEQLAQLRAEGCLWGQGTLFSRPVTAAMISEMLARPSGGRDVRSHAELPSDIFI